MLAARSVPVGFQPYVWASTVEEVARRRNLSPAQVLRFDANVPALPGVPAIPLGESFARLNEYPEGTYRELREAAAAYAGVAPDQVVVGAGADDLIGLVARTFLGPGRRAFVERPTYPLYAIATGIEGAEVADAGERADVIWVCNPNNPTGALRDPTELAALARANPDSIVAVDEAYFEYSGATVVPFIAEAPNLVAIRSLSKAFGFAALRVGWAYAPLAVADALNRARGPFNLSSAAQAAAVAALSDRAHTQAAFAHNARWLPWLKNEIESAGLKVSPSAGNFLLIHFPGTPARGAEAADAFLIKRGLILREVKVYGLPNCLRLTVGTEEENCLVVQALKDFTAGWN